MSSQIEFKIHPKENIYFAIKVVMALIIYCSLIGILTIEGKPETIALKTVFIFYGILILSYVFFRLGIFIGYLKGNAIKVSPLQFPDIFDIANKQSERLGLSHVPDVYIMQSGGILNAFATRFFGTNYIVLYSEVVEAAFEKDKLMLEFIIGHELGHVKRKHLLKRILLFPAVIVPFLGPAYSRACEYTCDNIGYALCPKGAKNGLLLLVSGRGLFSKVNVREYTNQSFSEDGFWHWFAEKVSSHPHITKRLLKFPELPQTEPQWKSRELIVEEPKIVATPSHDYSKYMPK